MTQSASVPGLVWIRWAFLALGIGALVAGVVVVLYTVLDLRPRTAALSTELRAALQDAEHLTGRIAAQRALFTSAFDTLRASQQSVAAIPPVLERTEGLLGHAAVATTFSGEAIREIETGITGLVAPSDELERSRAALTGTVDQMEALAESTQTLRAATADLAAHLDELAGEMAGLPALRDGAALQVAHERFASLDRAVAAYDIPGQTLMAGISAGLGLIALGLFSLAIAIGIVPLATALAAR